MKSVQIQSKSAYYDTLPYESYSFPYSHPARLAAIARLFSLNPPSNKKFRVLELGAASGGNLIPLAMFYPEVELIGIDYSAVQVEQGQKLIESLGLKDRVQLLCQSITDIGDEIGQFDYIICHGVYSWVPNEVQDAIINTIQHHLKPQGIAYVSYNIYPGWKRLEVIRDMMVYHTRKMDENKAQERMTQGRAIVDFIRNMSHENSAIRQMIDAPWDSLKDKADSYLGHEFLEPVNQPCYFLDFTEKLNEHQLAYLADAEPSISFIQNMPEDKAKDLIAASHNNQVMLEQYMDFLDFRQFRKSLIVHQSASQSMKRRISADVFDKLHYSVNSCVEEQAAAASSDEDKNASNAVNQGLVNNELKPQGYRFVFNQRQSITTHNDADYALLQSISELAPRVFNAAQLLEIAHKKNDDPKLATHLSNLLNRLTLSGCIEIWDQLPSESPSDVVAAKPYIPEVLRRFYQETGHLSNYRHSTVALNIIQKELIPLLDGTHDQAQLLSRLRQAYDEKRINIFDQDNQPLAEPLVEDALKTHLQRALELFSLNALLYNKSDRDDK